jgi:SAM-dependent methyltransferase
MPTNKYTTYHNYLAKNWNKKVAKYIIKNEEIGELKYSINTTGIDDLKKLKKSGIDIFHASIYMPVPYDMLEEIFTTINISNYAHFLDIGCGKGRAMVVANHFGVKKISGIDFSKDLCEAATANFDGIKKHFPKTKIKIYHNDAFYFKIEKDVDCIFMFNPFDDIIMSGVLENIEISLQKKPRKMTIIYINPVDKELMFANGFKEIYHVKKMRYLEASVLLK